MTFLASTGGLFLRSSSASISSDWKEWRTQYKQKVYHMFIPDEGVSVILDKRRKYYTALVDGSCTVKQCWETERELLKDYPKYVPPSHVPNQLEAQLIGISDYLKILTLLGKIPKPTGA